MRTRWGMALVALVLVVAACGGGDSDDADDSSDEAAATTSGGDGGDTTDAPTETSEASSGGGSANSAWCDLADDTQAQFDLAAENPFQLFTPDGMAELDSLLDRAVEAAPPEIRSDVALTRENFGELRGLLEQYDFNLLEISEAELTETFDQAALDQAANNIERYNQEVCGITPADGITEVTDPPADDGNDAPSTDAPIDLFVESLTSSLGISEEQARCLADELDIGSILQEGGDPNAVIAEGIFDVLAACDISAADLVG